MNPLVKDSWSTGCIRPTTKSRFELGLDHVKFIQEDEKSDMDSYVSKKIISNLCIDMKYGDIRNKQ